MSLVIRKALAVCCLLAATWSHAAAPTPDKLLPPDTILVITAPDYSALRKATEHLGARGRIVVLVCEDNLIRGASGVAVQNFNRMLGLDEKTALW